MGFVLRGGQEEDYWEGVQIYTHRTPFISDAWAPSVETGRVSGTESARCAAALLPARTGLRDSPPGASPARAAEKTLP